MGVGGQLVLVLGRAEVCVITDAVGVGIRTPIFWLGAQSVLRLRPARVATIGETVGVVIGTAVPGQ